MVAAVIGGLYGDEGKGMFTNHLCSQVKKPLVVRFSGGGQAGHTVRLADGRSHVFSQFGSGTLQGAPTYWLNTCTLEPVSFINELDKLHEISIAPQIYIHPKTPLVTPYDISLGRLYDKYTQHGSCGKGIGQTWAREKDFYSLTFGDLLAKGVFDIKFNMIRNWYQSNHESMKDINPDLFLLCAHEVGTLFRGLPPADEYDIIFEGSQGLMLDPEIGFFPHVTRSSISTRTIMRLGFAPDEVYLVTRAYQTRHGNGPLTNKEVSCSILSNPMETNINNEWQGEFRKTALDLDVLRYAIERDPYISMNKSKVTWVITCLDHLQDEYVFTANGRESRFAKEDDFIDWAKDFLEIDEVIRVRSPYGPQ
jgi:adenylosuccinate synthase